MKSTGIFTTVVGLLGVTAALCQIQPPAALRTGPGVQAAQDEREPEVLKACKTPPAAGGRRGGPGRGPAPAPAQAGPRDYKVVPIPDVVAAGQQWKEVWEVDGNNADGIIATLANQREFAKLEGGGNGDGSTFDARGRLYVTTNPGVQVIGSDGKYLGLIPTPRGIISVAFSGSDRKTLYAVARDNAQNKDWIIALPMTAQGPKGRGK